MTTPSQYLPLHNLSAPTVNSFAGILSTIMLHVPGRKHFYEEHDLLQTSIKGPLIALNASIIGLWGLVGTLQLPQYYKT